MMLAHGGDTCIPAPGGGGVSRDTWQLQLAGTRGTWQLQIAGTRAVRAAAKLQISSGVRQGWAAAARGWWAAFLQPAPGPGREIRCQVTTDQPSPAQPSPAQAGGRTCSRQCVYSSQGHWLQHRSVARQPLRCAVLCVLCVPTCVTETTHH